ncbi:hypothetical protein Y1Q_0008534 [Alligator mississippiensis]|uniref:Uncharacterized protein n=1 Tax=Alligator mississippiensis TaxID=8496 RepID=A0A151M1Q7_ALLMI|nr:hypothetical protein Y1Q_0008534 [Alligator mississippiensis]
MPSRLGLSFRRGQRSLARITRCKSKSYLVFRSLGEYRKFLGSRDHRTHSVIPVKEAAQAYKEKVEDNVKALKKEREKLLEFKESGDRKNEEYLNVATWCYMCLCP